MLHKHPLYGITSIHKDAQQLVNHKQPHHRDIHDPDGNVLGDINDLDSIGLHQWSKSTLKKELLRAYINSLVNNCSATEIEGYLEKANKIGVTYKQLNEAYEFSRLTIEGNQKENLLLCIDDYVNALMEKKPKPAMILYYEITDRFKTMTR